MHQGKGMIRNAAPVRVVNGDAQVGLVVEQPVHNVGRLACGWDGLSVVGRMTGGVVRVEQRGRLAPVPGVVGAKRLAATRGQEVHPTFAP